MELVRPRCARVRAGRAGHGGGLARHRRHRGVWRRSSTPRSRLRRHLSGGRIPAGHALDRQRAVRIGLGRLAETLRRLAEAGPQDFYTGEIAQTISADMAALGGRLSAADLANYEATIEETPETGYRECSGQDRTGIDRRADTGGRAGPSRGLARSRRGARRRGLRGLRRGVAGGLRRAPSGHGRGRRRRPRVLHQPSRRGRPGRHRGRTDPDPALALRCQGHAARRAGS